MIDILAILLEATELKGCASGIVGALAHVDYIAHIVACTDTVGTLAPVGEFIIKVYQSFGIFVPACEVILANTLTAEFPGARSSMMALKNASRPARPSTYVSTISP